MPTNLIVSIIDDDESVRTATSSLVRSLGWEARLYESAESFLGSGVVGETRCIISDVQMPGMSGLELQSRLTAKGYTIPFIFISAFRSDAASRQALAAGAMCFLSKPVDGSVVAHCLDQLRNNGASAQQNQQNTR
ncbi:response regulator [Caballeronia sp. dw_276]|uniref:response regulator transcription factor n=1 Tax=Caballeronia sp. dw_276 TaxID=2719795 RepID=UPI001BD6BEEA|nr:response regulator [Caballeronia sp. dw_276]